MSMSIVLWQKQIVSFYNGAGQYKQYTTATNPYVYKVERICG